MSTGDFPDAPRLRPDVVYDASPGVFHDVSCASDGDQPTAVLSGILQKAITVRVSAAV
jgi:hypothetical protein